MIDFLHQLQQATGFAGGKTHPGEPVQVAPRQVGKQPSLVFAVRHLAGDQQEQIFRFHTGLVVR